MPPYCLGERRQNVNFLSGNLFAIIPVVVAVRRRTHGDFLGNIGNHERKLSRKIGKYDRVPCGQFHRNDNLLVHLHFGDRLDLYLHNRGACKKYDSE